MKTPSTFEPYLDTRPEVFTAAIVDSNWTTPPSPTPPRLTFKGYSEGLADLDGSTFTDTNPWARGGLNE